MKFPYGLSDFATLIEEHYFYQDRTDRIPLLEEAGRQLVFIRPRRFGKSLLLSMLEHYYDLNRAGQFEALFGQLAIGTNPTPLRNRYFVMKWDFSLVKSQGEVREIEAALHRHINLCVEHCAERYGLTVHVDTDDAIYSFGALLNAIQAARHKLYLLIDEYDNFANEVLMSRQGHYEALLYGEGLLKTVFKAVKAAAGGQGLDRVFITGVSPVVMSDMTSGYNVAQNIYLDAEFNDLCGFTEREIAGVLEHMAGENAAWSATQALDTMRTFYNGYRFCDQAGDGIYNPTLSLYFLKHLQKHGEYPDQMLDENLAMDRNKLIYISRLPHGEDILIKALSGGDALAIAQLARRFGVEDVLNAVKDQTFMASLLYYFGVLTWDGVTLFGDCRLKIPNLVARSLYVERMQDLWLPEYEDKEAIREISQRCCRYGELQPLCDFIEQRYFKILSNRDYRWSNELLIKIAFMTLLFNDNLYMMVSETEVDHGYVDLSLIVRPDKRQYQALDLLLEFKYLSLQDLDLSGQEIATSPRDALVKLPAVAAKLGEAGEQAQRYGAALTARYGLTGLRCYAVVALGFERVVFHTVECAD
ncbi:MAG: AAA family ATPase [Methylococcaceae bacterium]|nr:MAG: AAA family ATPase [Methylococcaceae bacterium]